MIILLLSTIIIKYEKETQKFNVPRTQTVGLWGCQDHGLWRGACSLMLLCHCSKMGRDVLPLFPGSGSVKTLHVPAEMKRLGNNISYGYEYKHIYLVNNCN